MFFLLKKNHLLGAENQPTYHPLVPDLDFCEPLGRHVIFSRNTKTRNAVAGARLLCGGDDAAVTGFTSDRVRGVAEGYHPAKTEDHGWTCLDEGAVAYPPTRWRILQPRASGRPERSCSASRFLGGPWDAICFPRATPKDKMEDLLQNRPSGRSERSKMRRFMFGWCVRSK